MGRRCCLMSMMNIRRITGRPEVPQLFIYKELKEIGVDVGDFVKVWVEGEGRDKRIVIKKAEIQ